MRPASTVSPMRRDHTRTLWILMSIVLLVTSVVGGGAALLTTRLYTPSPLERDRAEVVADVLPRLTFLRRALYDGAAERMQRLFPEGYFFTYALYGLTWIDVGMSGDAHRVEALEQARWALAALDSEAGRAPFSAELTPPHGVFYTGWTSWLRGGVVRLAGGPAAAPEEAQRFFADTDALAAAFSEQLDRTGSPFLPAYPRQAWPVDSTVAVAALGLADQLAGRPIHAPLIERWLRAADTRRDAATGLLPHRVDPDTGHPVEGARATSQTLTLRFLREVAPDVARRDWLTFREQFASTVAGVPGIREHPRGVDLPGDVDSGPLILGMSASASVVALGDAVLFGDRPMAAALCGLAEATGFRVDWRGTRRYLGGVLPVGDAFLAWSLMADGWLVPSEQAGAGSPLSYHDDPSPWWRVPWHVATVLVVAPWLVSSIVLVRRVVRGR